MLTDQGKLVMGMLMRGSVGFWSLSGELYITHAHADRWGIWFCNKAIRAYKNKQAREASPDKDDDPSLMGTYIPVR